MKMNEMFLQTRINKTESKIGKFESRLEKATNYHDREFSRLQVESLMVKKQGLQGTLDAKNERIETERRERDAARLANRTGLGYGLKMAGAGFGTAVILVGSGYTFFNKHDASADIMKTPAPVVSTKTPGKQKVEASKNVKTDLDNAKDVADVVFGSWTVETQKPTANNETHKANLNAAGTKKDTKTDHANMQTINGIGYLLEKSWTNPK